MINRLRLFAPLLLCLMPRHRFPGFLFMPLFCLPIMLAWTNPAQAHAVHHHIDTGDAIVITLSHGQGKPFAGEKYTLTPLNPAGLTAAGLSGHTDSAGRIVFLPGEQQRWQLKAMTTHGHGVSIEFSVPAPIAQPPAEVANPAPALTPAPAITEGPSEASLALFGLSLIIGGFGAYQLFAHRRR